MKFIILLCLLIFCGVVTAQKKNVPNKIYTKVDVEAEFKGGASAWARFMIKNLNVPAECIEDNLFDDYPNAIMFIVRIDGTTDSIKTNRADSCCWNNEIRHLIKLSDKMWTPALVNGKAVDSYKKVPIGCILLETE
jgi:protein TonB